MRAYRHTGACGTGLLFNMLLEMIGPVVFVCLQWVGSMDTKTAERAVGNIFGKFVQYIQVCTDAQIADNSFQDTRDTFDTQATRDAFASGLYGEIAAPLHGPGDHTGIGRQQFNDAGTNNSTGFLYGSVVKGRIQQIWWQRTALGPTDDHSPQFAIGMVVASMTQDFA